MAVLRVSLVLFHVFTPSIERDIETTQSIERERVSDLLAVTRVKPTQPMSAPHNFYDRFFWMKFLQLRVA